MVLVILYTFVTRPLAKAASLAIWCSAMLAAHIFACPFKAAHTNRLQSWLLCSLSLLSALSIGRASFQAAAERNPPMLHGEFSFIDAAQTLLLISPMPYVAWYVWKQKAVAYKLASSIARVATTTEGHVPLLDPAQQIASSGQLDSQPESIGHGRTCSEGSIKSAESSSSTVAGLEEM